MLITLKKSSIIDNKFFINLCSW